MGGRRGCLPDTSWAAGVINSIPEEGPAWLHSPPITTIWYTLCWFLEKFLRDSGGSLFLREIQKRKAGEELKPWMLQPLGSQLSSSPSSSSLPTVSSSSSVTTSTASWLYLAWNMWLSDAGQVLCLFLRDGGYTVQCLSLLCRACPNN